MESKKENNSTIQIQLSSDEALILLEWLSRLNENDLPQLFHDQAEQRILFDLEAVLEKVVDDAFHQNYREILSRAWNNIRDK